MSKVASYSMHEVRKVAVRAGVDPRTVKAYMSGKKLHSTTVARVQEAFESLVDTSLDTSMNPTQTEVLAELKHIRGMLEDIAYAIRDLRGENHGD